MKAGIVFLHDYVHTHTEQTSNIIYNAQNGEACAGFPIFYKYTLLYSMQTYMKCCTIKYKKRI